MPRKETLICDLGHDRDVVGMEIQFTTARGGSREVILCPEHIKTVTVQQMFDLSRPAGRRRVTRTTGTSIDRLRAIRQD